MLFKTKLLIFLPKRIHLEAKVLKQDLDKLITLILHYALKQ